MAREKSCNLDKEEAEILKPSSSSSTPPAVPPATSPAALFHKPPQELPIKRPKRPETSASDPRVATSGGPEDEEEEKPSDKEVEAEALGRSAHRCSSCRRRVGLTGFRCRCGDLFCALHRYSDAHDCSFDYKAAGRAAISKANPLIRAAKIIKI